MNDASIEAMCVNVCTNKYGVCNWGLWRVVCFHVRTAGTNTTSYVELYLVYMDRVRRYARGKCVVFGIDAVSPLWFSKGGSRSRENEMRGRILEEWIVLNGMIVLNRVSSILSQV